MNAMWSTFSRSTCAKPVLQPRLRSMALPDWRKRDQRPALIILDLMLPNMPGLEVCKILKTNTETRQIPIMMLTAKAEEMDRIVGLEFGADDYVTKQFSPREVVLRIRGIMRRGEEKQDEDRLTAGPITVDPERYEVSVNGKRINLPVLNLNFCARS
jgi:DNA-binding response OmpR family regulator